MVIDLELGMFLEYSRIVSCIENRALVQNDYSLDIVDFECGDKNKGD